MYYILSTDLGIENKISALWEITDKCNLNITLDIGTLPLKDVDENANGGVLVPCCGLSTSLKLDTIRALASVGAFYFASAPMRPLFCQGITRRSKATFAPFLFVQRHLHATLPLLLPQK